MKVINRSANYNYNILEKMEAGIDLTGPEVKSAREGRVVLDNAFVQIRDGEAYLINARIHPYQNSEKDLNPTRARKLLLHHNEIESLAGRTASTGLTLIPLSLYNKGNLLKIEIALARGKKSWDKREALRKKTIERDIDQALRGKI